MLRTSSSMNIFRMRIFRHVMLILVLFFLHSFQTASAHTLHHSTPSTTHHPQHHAPVKNHTKTRATRHKHHHAHKQRHLARDRVDVDLAAALPEPKSIAEQIAERIDGPHNHQLASVNLDALQNKPVPQGSFVSSVEKDLLSFVHKTVTNLHYSSYKLGGSRFDTTRGVYVVDCSNFVDHILQKIYPNAYSSLVNSTGTDTPATTHYYHFFNNDLNDDSVQYWNKIADIEELRPGDILVFRYKNSRGAQTGGHVMVVMDKPIRVDDVFFVRIADSASSGHSEDTRRPHKSGIGIGTLLLKANPKTGKPSAYAWGVGGYWNKNVNFAMARPIEMDAGINA